MVDNVTVKQEDIINPNQILENKSMFQVALDLFLLSYPFVMLPIKIIFGILFWWKVIFGEIQC